MKYLLSKAKSFIFCVAAFFMSGLIFSCHYLDIVPDNIATVDFAFRLRSQAEKFLFTCYSYLPHFGSQTNNPSLISGDEVWFYYPYESAFYGKPSENWEIARGNQSVTSPYFNFWDGEKKGEALFQAIRDCNTFLENVDEVPDMESDEKARWKSEVLFLKAYYHWYLLRMYGPIPIVKKNAPVDVGLHEVKTYREPVDSVFEYITELIDEALEHLPDKIDAEVTEMGRVTRPVALAIKARILMNAASPLFNGNEDMSSLIDNKGRSLFSTNYEPSKWEEAANAVKEAIDASMDVGYELYRFNPLVNLKLGDTLQLQMDIRNVISEKWNSEIIWGYTQHLTSTLQQYAQPVLDPTIDIASNGDSRPYGEWAPPLHIAEMFYTENGLPIDQDRTWEYNERYSLDTARNKDRFYIKSGYVTAKLNFDREPRFYADLGFDGGVWYGQGKTDTSDLFHLEGKLGQIGGRRRTGEHSITGYYCKKLVNYLNILQTTGKYQIQSYPFPIIRLADLYLYYAEALNEVEGPTGEVLEYLNKIRRRAGIPDVEISWSDFSKSPNKYQSKEGMREIIHQERLIEMAFEGNRYWDLRRWKEAEKVLNEPIQGWDIAKENAEEYYRVTFLFNQEFRKRDYFWPIKERNIIVNDNLKQNLGW